MMKKIRGIFLLAFSILTVISTSHAAGDSAFNRFLNQTYYRGEETWKPDPSAKGLRDTTDEKPAEFLNPENRPLRSQWRIGPNPTYYKYHPTFRVEDYLRWRNAEARGSFDYFEGEDDSYLEWDFCPYKNTIIGEYLPPREVEDRCCRCDEGGDGWQCDFEYRPLSENKELRQCLAPNIGIVSFEHEIIPISRANDRISFTAILKNTGNTGSSEFDVSLEFNDEFTRSRSFPALRYNQSMTLTEADFSADFSTGIPTDLETNVLRLNVSPNVTEDDTDSHDIERVIEVPKPDISIAAVDFIPLEELNGQGRKYAINVTVQNVGKALTQNFDLVVRRKFSAEIFPIVDQQNFTRFLGDDKTFDVVELTGFLPIGIQDLEVELLPIDFDINYDNNLYAETVEVEEIAPDPSLAEIQVTQLAPNGNTQQVQVDLSLTNIQEFSADFSGNISANIFIDNVLSDSFSENVSLPYGDFTSISRTFSITPGNHTIRAEITAVPDPDPSNNSAENFVEIVEITDDPDLAIEITEIDQGRSYGDQDGYRAILDAKLISKGNITEPFSGTANVEVFANGETSQTFEQNFNFTSSGESLRIRKWINSLLPLGQNSAEVSISSDQDTNNYNNHDEHTFDIELWASVDEINHNWKRLDSDEWDYFGPYSYIYRSTANEEIDIRFKIKMAPQGEAIIKNMILLANYNYANPVVRTSLKYLPDEEVYEAIYRVSETGNYFFEITTENRGDSQKRAYFRLEP